MASLLSTIADWQAIQVASTNSPMLVPHGYHHQPQLLVHGWSEASSQHAHGIDAWLVVKLQPISAIALNDSGHGLGHMPL